MTTDSRNAWSEDDFREVPEGCVFVKGCARCDAPGHILRRVQMQEPMVDPDGTTWPFWAMCPVSGDPVLIRHSKEPGRKIEIPDDIEEGLDEAWAFAWEEWDRSSPGRLPLPGTSLIAMERARQVDGEGFAVERDDRYTDGELQEAAMAYLVHAGNQDGELAAPWPWSMSWWKPSPGDPIRDLQKAGALIAAEIDRLIRAGHECPEGHHGPYEC